MDMGWRRLPPGDLRKMGLDVGPPPTTLAGLTLTACGWQRHATYRFPPLFHLRVSGLQIDKLSSLRA